MHATTKQTHGSSISLRGDNAENRARWNDFLANCPTSNFYQRFEWKAINEQEFGHETFYLLLETDRMIQGAFPMVLVSSRLFGRILCSMPFVNFGGPVTNDTTTEEALLEEACNIAAKRNVDYLEIRSTRPLAGNLQSSEKKVSLTVKLGENADDIWNAFKSKHRTNIRRVYKDDVRVVSGHSELLDTFYEVMCRSWRALGTPIFSKRYFAAILAAFGDDIRIFVAYHGHIPVATTFNGHFKDTVEGMWAGSVPEGRRLQVNYVLYWEMIKDACERGFSQFHLGRSTIDTGGESFKKKWNAETTQLYWQYFMPSKGELPQLNVDNPKFRLAIQAWRQMPLWLTKTVGPLISRSIP
jgi:FemAB-related protein (PEP-CTERM system-associated)